MTQKGPAIAIMQQYALLGTGRSIHSSGQLEAYGNKVDDRSMKVSGRQCIETNEGYVIPLDIIHGLPYLKMEPYSDKEWEELPHVILTSGERWNPKILDVALSEQEDWYNTVKQLGDGLIQTPFDQYGNFKERSPEFSEAPALPVLQEGEQDPDLMDHYEGNLHSLVAAVTNLNELYVMDDDDMQGEVNSPIEVQPIVKVKTKEVNYEKYRPHFLHVPVEKIRKTFENTTQYATSVLAGKNYMQTHKSPFPALNVRRRHEPVATDTMTAATPAIGGGHTFMQVFIGRKSLVIDVYPMSSTAQFVNTLEDNNRKRGAMDKLISDHASVEMSRRVKDILRALCIDDWQSEPHYQWQNHAERRWKHFKKNIQWYMNLRNVPGNCWFLAAQWIADIMNLTAEKSLGWRTPLEVLTGETQDISIVICGFMFWDVVYIPRYEEKGYRSVIGRDTPNEIRGRFVGFSWDVGHAMTFKILTDDTKKIICRSRVRLAKEGEHNLMEDIRTGATPIEFISSKRDESDPDLQLPTIDVSKQPFEIDAMALLEDKTEDEVPAATEAEEALDAAEEKTPMDSPLKDMPEVETVDEDDELPPQLRERTKLPSELSEEELARFLVDSLKTDNPVETTRLPPEEMIGRTFLMPPEEDGTRVRAKIIELVHDLKKDAHQDPEYVKFKCLVNNERHDVVAYNQIIDFIEKDDSWDGRWCWTYNTKTP